MSMVPATLQSSMAADILSAIQAAFPIPAALLDAEKATIAAKQQALASAIAQGSASDIVTTVKAATVGPGSFTAPGGGGPVTGAGALT